MSEKLYIPRFRYLTQDSHGVVRCHVTMPCINEHGPMWSSDFHSCIVSEGAQNTDWQNTLIDLDDVNAGCAGYTFESGILKPVDCDGGNDAAKDRYKL